HLAAKCIFVSAFVTARVFPLGCKMHFCFRICARLSVSTWLQNAFLFPHLCSPECYHLAAKCIFVSAFVRRQVFPLGCKMLIELTENTTRERESSVHGR